MRVDLNEILRSFVEQVGGEKAVGKLLFDEFRLAKGGSVVRQRILDMVLSIAKLVGRPEIIGCEKSPRLVDKAANDRR